MAVHDPLAQRELAAAIARASRGEHAAGSGTLDAATALTVPRPSGRASFNLLVWPLRLAPGRLLIDMPSALILVTDPTAGTRAPVEELAAIYGFTSSEIALVSLLIDGRTLKEASDRLGVSINTVKTHMKRLFAKTDTRRQAELIRLVLQFPPLAS